MSRTILAIGPHTDDIEIGCGASLNKWGINGDNFTVVHLSHVFNHPISRKIIDLAEEASLSAGELGISLSNVHIYDFPVRRFNEHRQEILDLFITLKKTINPDIVLVPSTDDRHQDHQVVTQEALRAFYDIPMLGYDINSMVTGKMYISVDHRNVVAKLNALSKYESQRDKFRMGSKYIEADMMVKGLKIKVEYAETFEILRMIEK